MTARYVTTNVPPPETLPGEPWPFAPAHHWRTFEDETGIHRPVIFGLALCVGCRAACGERWPGQAHAYCNACRGVPARPDPKPVDARATVLT